MLLFKLWENQQKLVKFEIATIESDFLSLIMLTKMTTGHRIQDSGSLILNFQSIKDHSIAFFDFIR